MSTHVTSEQLDRLRDGTLPPAAVADVGRHAMACEMCGKVVGESLSIDRMVRDLRIQIEADQDAEHLSPDALMAFADGMLHGEEREARVHLEECEICRSELDELARWKKVIRPRRRWAVYAIAASMAAIALVLPSLDRRSSTTPRPAISKPIATQPPVLSTKPIVPAPGSGYGRPEWDTIVRAARAGEPLPMPRALRTLRHPSDILRGPEDPPGSDPVSPSGMVVETTRPAFTWNARSGDRSTVLVLAGDREVVRSESLTTATWRTPRDLSRGVTYTWQVEIDRNGELEVIPSPPARPPQFHILDAATHAGIEAARRQHPTDPLFLGIIYARAGLIDEARTELRRVREGADVPTAQRLLRELDSWSVPHPAR